MSWNIVLKIRGQAERLQKKSVEDFNTAAEKLDDAGRSAAHKTSRKADKLFERACRLAERENRISQRKKS